MKRGLAVLAVLAVLGSACTPDEPPRREARPGATTAPAGSLASDLAPPELVDPEFVDVTDENRALELDPRRDYELRMTKPLTARGGLTVTGGRNVVLIGGHIHFDQWYDDRGKANRALLLREQTGTVHIEGLLVSGNVAEGINLEQGEGATVQLENIRIEQATGSESGNHADLIQSWAGPRRLVVDGFTGRSTYQGFFLLPRQHHDGPDPDVFVLRRVNLSTGGGYAFWADGADWPIELDDVWVDGQPDDRDSLLWPKPSTGDRRWEGVRLGRPPGGDFVPADRAGLGYEP